MIIASGNIVILGSQCPWKDHLFDIEKESNLGSQILYGKYLFTFKNFNFLYNSYYDIRTKTTLNLLISFLCIGSALRRQRRQLARPSRARGPQQLLLPQKAA